MAKQRATTPKATRSMTTGNNGEGIAGSSWELDKNKDDYC